MKRSTLAAAVSMTLIAAAAPAQVSAVYEQPPATSEGDVSGGYYSNLIANTFLYDGFTVAGDTLIDELHVWGFGFQYEQSVEVGLYEGGGTDGLGRVVAAHAYTQNEISVEVTEGWIEDAHLWWREELVTIPIDPPIRVESGRAYVLGVSGEYELIWSYGAISGDMNILYSDASQQVFWDQNDTNMAFRLMGREVSQADLAEPYATLDYNDVIAFLVAFVTGGAGADITMPAGVFDFADVVAFLQSFAAGAP